MEEGRVGEGGRKGGNDREKRRRDGKGEGWTGAGRRKGRKRKGAGKREKGEWWGEAKEEDGTEREREDGEAKRTEPEEGGHPRKNDRSHSAHGRYSGPLRWGPVGAPILLERRASVGPAPRAGVPACALVGAPSTRSRHSGSSTWRNVLRCASATHALAPARAPCPHVLGLSPGQRTTEKKDVRMTEKANNRARAG